MKKFTVLVTILLQSFSQTSSAQIASQWETLINGVGDFGDQYNAVVVDANNDIYVAGYTVNTNADRDLLVVKYNANAQLQWRKVFSGSGNGPDEGKKIILHPNGNLLVSGYVNNKSVGNDFFTAMLKTNGDTLWTRSYNSPTTNLYDEPNAITIDAQGNIVIAGDSDRDPSPIVNNDYLLVKYNTSGSLLWSVRYNSTANDNDRAMAVVTDATNNIYVAGRVFNGGDDDFVTIKYNSAGTQQWLKKYDNGGTDRPTSIGIDQNGLVYVVGRSSNGTDDDYRLITYNAAGVQQSTAFYDVAGHDRPIDMVVNPTGGCVITGRTDGNPAIGINYDIHTVAFAANGTRQWVGIFKGAALNDDVPSTIRFGANGSVLVTGVTDADNTANIKNDVIYLQYSSTGSMLVQQIFKGSPDNNDEGMDLAQLPNGNVVVVGHSSDANQQTDAVALIYKGNAAPIATHFLKGMGDNSENVRNLIVDANGTVFYCGYSVNKNTNRDFSYGCLDDKGTLLWRKDTSGTLFGSDEEANAIAFDQSGNIIVSGFLKNSGTSSDVYVEKISKTGVSQWKFGYDSPIHESDRANDMAVNAVGDIYIVGKSDVDASWQVNDDILILKISAAGTQLWRANYASATLVDRAQFVKVLSNGDIIVGGVLQNGTNDNIILLKYSSTGSLIWSKVFDYFGGNDKLNDLSIDNTGNIFLTGQTQRKAGSADFDAFVACVNQSGQQTWIQYHGITGAALEEGVSLTVMSDNTVWVAGNIDTDTTTNVNLDVFLMSYDNTGKAMLPALVTYGGVNSDEVDDLDVIGNGTPCVAIHTNTANMGDLDYSMGLLEFKNDKLNLSYQRTISDTIDVANVIKWLSSSKFLYVGGSSFSKSGQRDMLLGKYFQGVASVKDSTHLAVRVQPNPVGNQFAVTLPVGGEIFIYDMRGNLLYHDEVVANQAVNIDASMNWSTGIYQLVFKHYLGVQTIQIVK